MSEKKGPTIFIFEEENVGERMCRFVFQVSPLLIRSPLALFGNTSANAFFVSTRTDLLTMKFKLTNLMIHEVSEIFHHYLFEHVQVSDQNLRLLPNVESECYLITM